MPKVIKKPIAIASEKKKGSDSSLRTLILPLIASITLIASIYGHGVIAGIASTVNLEPNSFAASPLDVLFACGTGLTVVFVNLFNSELTYNTVIATSLFIAKMMPPLVLAALLIYKLVDYFRKNNISFIPSKVKNSFIFRIISGFFTQHIVKHFYYVPCKYDKYVGDFFLVLAILMTLPLVFLFMPMISSMGITSGQGYVFDYVINPSYCETSKNRHSYIFRKKAKQPDFVEKFNYNATCVKVEPLDRSRVISSGRVVFMNSMVLILWDPKSGTAERIPISNLIVTTVDKLS